MKTLMRLASLILLLYYVIACIAGFFTGRGIESVEGKFPNEIMFYDDLLCPGQIIIAFIGMMGAVAFIVWVGNSFFLFIFEDDFEFFWE